MQFDITEPASVELNDAIEYYNLQSIGLGDTFFDVFLNAIRILRRYPNSGLKYTENTRKISLQKFPFNLIYILEPNHITIIAIAHQHRKPEYWIDRLKI